MSVGVGVPVCLVYIGVHSLFRAVFGKDRAIFCADIIFSVIATLISFFFMVFYNNGQVRLHLILGEALGFFVFMRVMGKYLSLWCFAAADLLHKAASKMLYPFLRVGRAFVNIFRRARVKITPSFKKKASDGEKVGENEKNVATNVKKFNLISKILLKIKNKSV